MLELVRGWPTTALLVQVGGQTILEYGDPAEVSYVASLRKSVLSMLYGRPVADGVIDLDRTIGELGIDDVEGLLAVERAATVRHLLTASSGVYHPSASPGGDEQHAPARGSQAPGTRFQYNNWDFNVLGTIYEQLTGRAVFDAVRDELAVPLGFQDFDRDRQQLLGVPQRSRHLAHHLFLSARDLARLGQLMLAGGAGLVPGSGCGKAPAATFPRGRWTTGTCGGCLGGGPVRSSRSATSDSSCSACPIAIWSSCTGARCPTSSRSNATARWAKPRIRWA